MLLLTTLLHVLCTYMLFLNVDKTRANVVCYYQPYLVERKIFDRLHHSKTAPV
ncbi:MAG TPA: hypothetical protein VGC99_12305 [Candidatus Tectomicrobia bacterium]